MHPKEKIHYLARLLVAIAKSKLLATCDSKKDDNLFVSSASWVWNYHQTSAQMHPDLLWCKCQSKMTLAAVNR